MIKQRPQKFNKDEISKYGNRYTFICTTEECDRIEAALLAAGKPHLLQFTRNISNNKDNKDPTHGIVSVALTPLLEELLLPIVLEKSSTKLSNDFKEKNKEERLATLKQDKESMKTADMSLSVANNLGTKEWDKSEDILVNENLYKIDDISKVVVDELDVDKPSL